MSSPRTIPPAPAPAPVPLPIAQNVPIQNPTPKKYSEGSMYEEMSPEDIEAWHRRYADFKKWRQDIPNKTQAGQAFSNPPGQSVGVRSFDHSCKESDTDTVPSTIMKNFMDAARARSGLDHQAGNMSHLPQSRLTSIKKVQSRSNLQARVETLGGSETPSSKSPSNHTVTRPPLSQKPVSSHNVAPAAIVESMKGPPIEIQPPSSKLPVKTSRLTNPQNSRSNQPTDPRPPPSQSPRPSEKLRSSVKPARPPPAPLLARPPGEANTAGHPLKPRETSHPSSTRPSRSPSEEIVPSPTPTAKYAEREAYISSALNLPLDMLAETEGGPTKIDSSSHFTTGRLDSLLGKNRSESRTKGSQRSAGSGTTLPTPNSERSSSVAGVEKADLARSNTTHSIARTTQRPETDRREHHYEGSYHLPVPGYLPGRSKTPSDATIVQAAKQPLPPSTHVSSQVTVVQPAGSHRHVSMQNTQSAGSQATIIKASRQPLPLLVTSQAIHADTIKIPVSVKTALGSPGPAARDPPTEATNIQSSQIPFSPSTSGSRGHHSAVITLKPAAEDSVGHASPRHIPLPPTVLANPSTEASQIPAAPSHRSQKPLRPALTPQQSFDGLNQAIALSRRQRDPSVGDLTAHFEPATYPLPPSGGTFFSSPEQVIAEAPRTTAHEVAFSTVQYIPPQSIDTTATASNHMAQPSTKSKSNQSNKSNKSKPPPTPSASAAAIPLPPSTILSTAHSTPRNLPSAPVPSLASPTARPPPPVTSSILPSHPIPASAIEILAPSPTSSNPTDALTEQRSLTHQALETDTHPHIHFSPGQISHSLRSDDDHVSFEVPSGSRGRLRVTLKWFRDGHRSARSSPRIAPERLSVVAEIEDRPPPLPPKTSSLMSKMMNKQPRDQSTRSKISQYHPPSEPPPQPQVRSRSTTPPSPNIHPIPEDHCPDLSPPPMKRDHPKSPTGSEQSHQHNPYYDPYYSGATLPAYAAMPQVYNMYSPPMAYRQPGAWVTNLGGPYRIAQSITQARNQPPPQNNIVESPSRESVDPPSDAESPQPLRAYSQPPAIGMNGLPQHNQTYWNVQEPKQGPSFWQKIFGKSPQQQQVDELRPEDSITVRNWARGVAPGGKPPTMIPTPYQNQVRPTILPQQGQRPTLAGTTYPGQGNNAFSAPRTTLYNVQGGYPPDYGRSRSRREPSVWEKFMYRRQTEEAIYRSPPIRRRRDLSSPVPVLPKNNKNRNIFGRRTTDDKRERMEGARFGADRNIRKEDRREETTRQDRLDQDIQRQKEKEERRRQRSLKRDAKALGLRREIFANVDQRDRPIDLGGANRQGRSGTLVGEWVGRFGRGRQRGQFPDSEAQVRKYQPTLWKDRLPFTGTKQSYQQTVVQSYQTRQQQYRQQPVRPERTQTLKRNLRITKRVQPTSRNVLGLGFESRTERTQNRAQRKGEKQGMMGMLGRLNLGNNMGNRRQ
ncbi:uncharacterized protein I206_105838 [Kwoniella pini CBS 10737]|uniref:Uncharacterized protein n=1 Tax=Kwoniella pini CBS 10737 TaxID=1296096 RepID=A0A1B9I0I9_9TREE|nr:uncharacterized protein I206_04658 [Kwoniella pini CBS 10737]OCF48971.1 hypothetical protein I206_04658 [Kwoniella pini CBS 10737]